MFLASALLFAFSTSSSAQTLGAGLSFFEDGTGVTVDYAKMHKAISGDRTLSWVGDLSYHGNEGINWLTLMGGLRMGGNASEKVRWHVQGLIGILRASASGAFGDVVDDICDDLDIDCGASDTSLVIAPGAGIDYVFDEKKALRVQLDIPFNGDGSGTRFWFGISLKLGN
jgi:hypothetical protein